MSHEIRTPMNAVIGFTDLLLAGELDAEQRRKVARIAESGQLTLTLLNDALEMSRIDAGGTVAAREPVAIGPLILDCVEMQRPALHGRPLELEVAIDPRIPAAIIGDSARLRQIVGNLIGNAIKFTSHGTITVKAAVVEDGWLEIEVQDTGIGIAADRQQQIFDRFAQADDTIHGRFGGTGLGLAISMGLANLMGGSIALRSVEHEGSCFTLRLPLEPTSRVAPIKGTNTLTAHEEIGYDQRLILIAEDNPINQEVIAAMLGKLGYRFEIAGTGAAAISKITNRAGSEYALVLMDLQMPELDGISATRRLREAGFDAAALPIIALTAHAFEADVERCLAAGMQGFLAKPIQLATLSEMLDRFLGTRVHG